MATPAEVAASASLSIDIRPADLTNSTRGESPSPATGFDVSVRVESDAPESCPFPRGAATFDGLPLEARDSSPTAASPLPETSDAEGCGASKASSSAPDSSACSARVYSLHTDEPLAGKTVLVRVFDAGSEVSARVQLPDITARWTSPADGVMRVGELAVITLDPPPLADTNAAFIASGTREFVVSHDATDVTNATDVTDTTDAGADGGRDVTPSSQQPSLRLTPTGVSFLVPDVTPTEGRLRIESSSWWPKVVECVGLLRCVTHTSVDCADDRFACNPNTQPSWSVSLPATVAGRAQASP